MNRLMHRWPLMAQEGESGGGGTAPAEQPPAEQPPAEQPPAEQKPTEQPPAEQPPAEQPPAEQKPTEQPPAEQPPKKAVNLMDDDPAGAGEEQPPAEPPTDEQVKAFRDGIKSIDLGEGVVFDDPALDAMQKPLMELTGNNPKKAEAIVKAYTDYRRAEIARQQERDDAFVNDLVAESQKRFGQDLKQVVSLAKAGGKRVFGEKLWNQMKSIPQFANNPDIIERLAAFGKSTKDDPGAVRKETGPGARSSDWRENMYGTHK